MPAPQKYANIDDYIATFPKDTQTLLQEVRATIRSAAPDAEETISYQIPSLKQGGKLILSFAGWKTYISLYPTPALDPDLDRRLEPYKGAKSTLRFPLNQPIPHDLISRVVQLLIEQRAPSR